MKRVATALLFSLALVASATAETKVKTYNEHSKLIEAASKQGRCALVIFSAGTEGLRSEQARQQLETEPFKQLVNRYFVLGKLNVREGGPLWDEYGDKFPEGEDPYWMVVTPQLDVIAGGTRDDITSPGGSWLRRLEQIGRRYPPIGKEDQEQAQEMLEEAWKALQEGQTYEAAQAAKRLSEVVWHPPMIQQGCERLLTQIEVRGEQALRNARNLCEDNPLQAARAYQEIVEQYTTELAPGRQAEQELRRLLMQNRDVAQQLQQFRREDRAKELLEKAQAEEEKDNQRSATGIYRIIVRSYADTDSFPAANEALTRLDPNYTPTTRPTTRPTSRPAEATSRPASVEEADHRQQPDADEAAAQSLLKLARNLHAAGMDTQAGNKLTECMKNYPDTDAAKTAASLYVEWGLQGD
ncbi:MAG: hypothetical protein ACP5HU_07460 [Phycisphaerae bacterium]